MKPGARLRAAVEVLETIETRHRPAAEALAEWGRGHRFAGSGDRAAIGNLVYDVLRRRHSLAARMQAETPRALVLAAAHVAFGMSADDIAAGADGSPHALEPLTPDEQAALVREPDATAPAHVLGDFPEWLAPSLERTFGDRAATEGAALARRAPVDLRVNTLKSERDRVLKALERYDAEATPHSPWGVRIPPPTGPGRTPNVEAEAGHGKGWFEVQDEGSQIAALLTGTTQRMQVLDLCAGAGGKTLALAAIMQNTGQIYAADRDGRRLTPIFDRLERAGARDVQVRAPKGPRVLADIAGACDLVLVDAPCTGSGTWRRNPDAKWRVRPGALDQRMAEQEAVLNDAVRFVKKGGRIAYVTCSLLRAENEAQVERFLGAHPDFLPVDMAHAARKAGVPELAAHVSTLGPGLRLSPATTGTDGFYVALLART